MLNDKDEVEKCNIATMISSISSIHNNNNNNNNNTNNTNILFKSDDINNNNSIPKSLDDIKLLLNDYLYHKSPNILFLKQLSTTIINILKKEDNCIYFDKINDNQTINIIGDIHGDIEDLHKIFECIGWPNKDNILIFNGDFVDRGFNSTEVISILFSLKILFPKYIYLIRGNHEDSTIGKAYGFFDEIYKKYKSQELYDMINYCFSYLPLCCYIKNHLFVVHGGLSRYYNNITLNDINKIKRYKFINVLPSPNNTNNNNNNNNKIHPDIIKDDNTRLTSLEISQIIEDFLWSDPDAYKDGLNINNKRGAGYLFGCDIIKKWLQSINAKIMVRSHECIDDGYEEIDCSDGYKLYTVFSSSDYSGGYNYGAILQFTNKQIEPKIIQFEAPEPKSLQELEKFNKNMIYNLLLKSSNDLLNEFTLSAIDNSDIKSNDYITINQWNNCISRVLSIYIKWNEILPIPIEIINNKEYINYKEFINILSNSSSNLSQSKLNLFEKHEQLSAIFKIFDIENDGRISKNEFITACNLLNHYLPKHKQAKPLELFYLADTNKSGFINYNEFCDLFTSGNSLHIKKE